MTQDEIIEMAVQCQLVNTNNCDGIYMDALQAFAKLVAAKEREACCKAIDEIDDGEAPEYRACQEAIRARGEA